MANPVTLGTDQDIAVLSHQAGDPRRNDREQTFIAGPPSVVRLRPAKVNFYLKVARKLGIESGQLLAGTGIRENDLADPLHLVEIAKYIRIVSNIHNAYGPSALAFTLGEQLTLGDLGILGYTVMTCADTEEATSLWHRYNPTFFGNLVEMRMEWVGDRLRLTYQPRPETRPDLSQFLIEEKLCCDVALQRLIGLPTYPAERLTLAYPEPPHADRYRSLLDCPVEFSAPRSTLLLANNALRIPLRGSDVETHEHCLKLMRDVANGITAGSTLSHRVKAILAENLSLGMTIDDVAVRLHCTARTLNRRLEKEAVNFSQLLTATRLETIENLLATTTLEADQIADRVGFSDVRSLRRFFKAHSGKTVNEFRAETLRSWLGDQTLG